MTKKNKKKDSKIHSINNNSNKEYGITTKIDAESFIMLHKAEVESIITNTNILNLKNEFFEKFGTLLVGGSISAYFTNISFIIPTIFLVLGIGLTILSVFEKIQKNKLIAKLFDEKLTNSRKS